MPSSYDGPPSPASTALRFSREPLFQGNRAVFPLELPGRGVAVLTIDVEWRRPDVADAPPDHAAAHEPADVDALGEARAWQDELPVLEADDDLIERVWERSLTDLSALRLEVSADGHTATIPAAGLPWFMAVFGRDSLITSYQSLLVAPKPAPGAPQDPAPRP